jgi:hypothetical protein
MNPRGVRGISLERVAIWIALASVAVFVVWFAIRIREIVVNPYQNADLGSSLMLAEFFPERGSGYVILGYYPWLESLFALDWTRWLPDHLAAWKAGPFVVYGATVVLAGWTVMRATSWRLGLVVALAMAAPAPFVIYMLGVPNQRLPLFVHAVVLAAFLVILPALPGWRRLWQVLWGAGLALTLAPGVASDPLMIPAGVLPFLAAVALGWRLRLLSPRLLAFAGAACLAGVAGGWLLLELAEQAKIIHNHDDVFAVAPAGLVLSNVGLLLENVALFAHGKFATSTADQIDGLNVLRELLAVAAVVATVIFGYVVVRSARPTLVDGARPAEQRLLAIYWGVSIVAVSLAFVIVTAPVGTNAIRYVTTLWPALLTLVAILYGRRAIAGLAILATVCAVTGCIELAKGFYTPGTGPPPDTEEAAAVEDFVAAHDLDHGYAGYWDAIPLSLQSDFKVRAYPIEPCYLPEEDRYCPERLHIIESWYEPKQDVRTFYVTNALPLVPYLDPPPASWGRPFKTARFGDLTIYAYDYDIASRLERDAAEPGYAPPGIQKEAESELVRP